MTDCRRVAYQAVRDRLPVDFSFEEFSAKLARYSFLPVKLGGRIVGAIMADGQEVHVAVLPEARGRWFNRDVREWFDARFTRCGRLITKVVDGHEAGHAFARRLGFRAVRHEGSMTFYEKAKA